MAVDNDYVAWIQEQLSAAGGISLRRMFGAAGLYRGEYESRHMPQFRPYRDRPEVSMAYYEVPADVIEDPEECVAWALRSVAAAGNRALSPKRPSPPKRPSAARKKAAKRSR